MKLPAVTTPRGILFRAVYAAIGLFIFGFGVYLTVLVSDKIGTGPWDVLNLGLSETLGISFGTACIGVSITVLLLDIFFREPIGISMLLDTFVVGWSVDFFDWIDIVPVPKTLFGCILMTLAGLVVMGATQGMYMGAALGAGPRDTLMVGLTKRFKKIPIGVVNIFMQGIVTIAGWMLGAKVGIGTVMVAFLAGPIMQLCFRLERFDATGIRQQNMLESLRVFLGKQQERTK